MANKKEMLGAGVRSVFSSRAVSTAPHKAAPRHERLEENRDYVASMRAPATTVGRPRKGVATGWDRSKEFHTSIVMDRDQYVELTQIAYEERLSVKAVMNRLLSLGIQAYRKKPTLIR